jgi:hypothetical protein
LRKWLWGTSQDDFDDGDATPEDIIHALEVALANCTADAEEDRMGRLLTTAALIMTAGGSVYVAKEVIRTLSGSNFSIETDHDDGGETVRVVFHGDQP